VYNVPSKERNGKVLSKLYGFRIISFASAWIKQRRAY
jgi:hypothetical protein